jgi:hypothetical protein
MKKKIILILGVVVLVLIGGFAWHSSEEAKLAKMPLEFEALENEDAPATDDLEISNSDSDVIVSVDNSREAPAVLRFGGKTHRLPFVSTNQTSPALSEGDVFTRTYSDENSRLKIDFKVTLVCDDADDSCEDNEFTVNLSLQNAGRSLDSKSLKATEGS